VADPARQYALCISIESPRTRALLCKKAARIGHTPRRIGAHEVAMLPRGSVGFRRMAAVEGAGAAKAPTTYKVQSLQRAAALLTCFSANEPELSIGELARRSHLPRSTVHRLVVNLVRLGFLARDQQTDRYRLGLLLAELGTIALSRMGLREKARPIMDRLADETGEVVCLAVLEQNRSVYVEVVEGHHGLRLRATVGSVAPIHSSATGTLLLAHMPEADVQRIAGQTRLPRLTPRTITSIEPLLQRLAEIRARGYSIDDGESEEGLTGLAAPVRAPSGVVQAALVIAGPGERVLADDGRRWAPTVVAAANEISASLGSRPS
jgi:IclR family transcriptional regulator, KDG regulon repressor